MEGPTQGDDVRERMKKSIDAMLGQVGPDFWDVGGAGAALDVAADEVEALARGNGLLALTTFDGRTVFPTWQVVQGAVLPGLAAVLAAFAGQPAWSVALWLTTAHDDLGGRTPVAALGAARGEHDRDAVAALAARTAEAWS